MAKSVTTIPATLSRFTAAPLTSTKKRRVAAYARVSTDNEEQLLYSVIFATLASANSFPLRSDSSKITSFITRVASTASEITLPE